MGRSKTCPKFSLNVYIIWLRLFSAAKRCFPSKHGWLRRFNDARRRPLGVLPKFFFDQVFSFLAMASYVEPRVELNMLSYQLDPNRCMPDDRYWMQELLFLADQNLLAPCIAKYYHLKSHRSHEWIFMVPHSCDEDEPQDSGVLGFLRQTKCLGKYLLCEFFGFVLTSFSFLTFCFDFFVFA